MWKGLTATATAWATSLMMVFFAIFSFSVIGPEAANACLLACGLLQFALALKFRRAALKTTGIELLVAQFFLLAYFFAPPESDVPNIDLPILWMVVLYSALAMVLLALAKICLDESGADRQPRPAGNRQH